MSFKLFDTPVALARSENPASVMTRAKRALKHLGLTIRKGKEGGPGPYVVVRGEMIIGAGEVLDIANWAKSEVAKLPSKTAAPSVAPAATEPAAAPSAAAAEPANEPVAEASDEPVVAGEAPVAADNAPAFE